MSEEVDYCILLFAVNKSIELHAHATNFEGTWCIRRACAPKGIILPQQICRSGPPHDDLQIGMYLKKIFRQLHLKYFFSDFFSASHVS